jgi:hypothetical protein
MMGMDIVCEQFWCGDKFPIGVSPTNIIPTDIRPTLLCKKNISPRRRDTDGVIVNDISPTALPILTVGLFSTPLA